MIDDGDENATYRRPERESDAAREVVVEMAASQALTTVFAGPSWNRPQQDPEPPTDSSQTAFNQTFFVPGRPGSPGWPNTV